MAVNSVRIRGLRVRAFAGMYKADYGRAVKSAVTVLNPHYR
jgi:hypothetical protein